MATKPFAFKSSKLSSAADELWSASKSGFKADDRSIKLDLGKTLVNGRPEKSRNTAEVTSTTDLIFGSRLCEKVVFNSKDDKDAKIGNSSISKEYALPNCRSEDDVPKSVSAESERTSRESTSFTKDDKEMSHFENETSDSKKLDEIEVITGEEGEKNVYHVMCKLHSFDSASNLWIERGITLLRINICNEPSSFTYRIVGRVMGNQRVVLNSQIFPNMIVEKVSTKRVKFSATTPESEVPVLFLATASEFIASQLYEKLFHIVEARRRETGRKRKVLDDVQDEEESESVSKKIPTNI